ncbi:MAG: CRTAC1 family protein [Balneolaceae bacterium]
MNHDRMVAKLDSIIVDAKKEPLKYFYANEFRLSLVDSLADANPGQTQLQYYQALEHQNSRVIEKSIPILQNLNETLADSVSQHLTHRALAVSYLRLAEVRNCFENYTPSNCILPFDDQAVHQNKSYIQSSIRHLDFLLERYPGNYTYQWMYNLAHIANGSYPEGMDSHYLIPGLQDHEDVPGDLRVPLFKDTGMEKNIGDNRISGSACTEDFTGNGRLDIFTTSYGFGDQVIFYESDGQGGFNDRTIAAGLEGIMGGLNIECADINNNGYVDILILRGAWLAQHGEHPNSLLRNNGDGTFTDITISSGLYEEIPTQTAAFADINQNGYLDIFVGNESSSAWQDFFVESDEEPQSYPSAFFMNNGNETFTRYENLNGFELDEFVKGASWGDMNNDGLPDLYVSVMGGQNKLFVHRGLDRDGLPQFEEISRKAGVQLPLFSFPTWFFDYNNDGLEDIFVITYDVRAINQVTEEVSREHLGLPTQSEYPRLYKNMGDETFQDVTEEMGLNSAMFGMGANFGDLNNNGYPDIYIGTGAPDLSAIIPNRLFLNHGGQRFYESTAISGVGHLQKGHGVSMADFDNNGTLDIYMVLGGAVEGDFYHNALFENQRKTGNWLSLKLEGVAANRQAIGARVEVKIPSGKRGMNSLYKTVSTGSSFGNNNTHLHFGLGDVESVDSILIRWPGSDEPQIIEQPAVNSFLHIRQTS